MIFTKYDKWGDYHWKEFERGGLYREHVFRILNWVKEADLLDVGCGDGLITSKLNAKGIDDNETAIKLAKKHGVNAEIGDVYKLSGHCKAVFMGDVLEHLEEPEKALREIKKITNKLYIVTPVKGDVLGNLHYQEWTTEELKEFMNKNGWGCLNMTTADNRIYAVFQK